MRTFAETQRGKNRTDACYRTADRRQALLALQKVHWRHCSELDHEALRSFSRRKAMFRAPGTIRWEARIRVSWARRSIERTGNERLLRRIHFHLDHILPRDIARITARSQVSDRRGGTTDQIYRQHQQQQRFGDGSHHGRQRYTTPAKL